jgi:hypothetical protein
MPEESSVDAWLGDPEVQLEIVKARKRLARVGSTVDPTLFCLLLDILGALQFSVEEDPGPEEPPEGFFDPTDDDDDEPWRRPAA